MKSRSTCPTRSFSNTRGKTYAIPETNEAEEVRLYHVEEPDNWVLDTTLITEIAAVDPTLIQHRGRWWMFLPEQPYPNTKLSVWYSDRLRDGWQPHPTNPVKTDVQSARPGGTPFRIDGQLYRQAQNSAGGYGNATVINEVTTITPETFEERPVQEYEPLAESQYPKGRHTLSTLGEEKTLIDGERRLPLRERIREKFDDESVGR